MSERGQGGGKHSCNKESAVFTTCFLEVYHNTHLHSYEAWATSESHYSLWCSSWVLGYDPMHILQQEILLSDNSTPTIEDKKKTNLIQLCKKKWRKSLKHGLSIFTHTSTHI